MPRITLCGPADFAGWRGAARQLVLDGVPPEQIEWAVDGEPPGLFGADAPSSPMPSAVAEPEKTDASSTFTVSRAFVEIAEHAALHSDPARFALLYRLLWRLRQNPRLMLLVTDPDIVRASDWAKTVRRDIHKMHAFVRFRMVPENGQEHYIAWHEPAHHVVEAAAPFFMRRFANLNWTILTPERTADWDGAALRFGPGAGRQDAPQEDALEDLWRDYYANIFNPARLNPDAMQREMPKRFWRNLPEAAMINPLIRNAEERTRDMVARQPAPPEGSSDTARSQAGATQRQQPSAVSPHAPPLEPFTAPLPAGDLGVLRNMAIGCHACPLWAPATQTVFGEGPKEARIVLVGEQPGDQEDLAGRPFVGPAGQLLDRALSEAGIDRRRLYITNAVKHFKFQLRGKRRLHQKPDTADIHACAPWLAAELETIDPNYIVAMGATAVQAVFGRPMPITRNRGQMMSLAQSGLEAGAAPRAVPRQGLITVHPSYLLRLPDAASKEREYRSFVEDLSQIRGFL